ncbi:hypothetical protein GGS23DRAFT_41395 [Durotheca rogersii]|uniref:uncharacterized protein n=1 Tax=Durotheca rogersii TaxID=419775 RepID=UPI00221EE3DD|nr:uncharacterized protein GGS23DRAFT_41395 [Durotheca rogersii]KAI5868639.1 hypothetical protein GGS23DRAFT_41395 [Durotheca rogersii]
MFAVPGWAVSADGLKAEAAAALDRAPSKDESKARSKKRKRPSAAPGNVTAANVADLWERVIEGRAEKKTKKEGGGGASEGSPADGPPRRLTLKEKKKLKKLRQGDAGPDGDGGQSEPAGAGSPQEPPGGPARKARKKKTSKARIGAGDESKQPEEVEGEAEAAAELSSSLPRAAPKPTPTLTPLQAAMREKLVSARFRQLNETLYTRPSAEALRLFADSPEMFGEYHEGFRRQVDVWPENPVDGYIRDVRQRARQKPPPSRHASTPADPAPLPRTAGVCTVADLGCGDAKLAAALWPERARLRLEVLSFDLQGTAAAAAAAAASSAAVPVVTRADIAALPLADGAVDVAVFCLALMGTNWPDFVDEAYRVLRWKGELWVAEIKSRFGPAARAQGRKKNSGAPVGHSVGGRRKVLQPPPGPKKGKAWNAADADADADEARLAVEVDGADDRREETDVSAFVEALRRRGFVLQGEPDLRNKMFVKMRFLKAASPAVGKGASGAKAQKGRDAIKFIEAEDDRQQGTVDESTILKPCVYKLR